MMAIVRLAHWFRMCNAHSINAAVVITDLTNTFGNGFVELHFELFVEVFIVGCHSSKALILFYLVCLGCWIKLKIRKVFQLLWLSLLIFLSGIYIISKAILLNLLISLVTKSSIIVWWLLLDFVLDLSLILFFKNVW